MRKLSRSGLAGMGKRSAGIAVICALLCGLGPANPVAQAQERATYEALLDNGLAEYEARHFTEARALFGRAFALDPNARLMRSLGMVEFELRNYRDSAAWLERALAATTAPLDADLASQTTHLLARARGFIGTLKLQVEPG